MRRRVLSSVLAVTALNLFSLSAQADTYHQLKACLRNCIDTTDAWTIERAICVADCYAAWADQKLSLNIDIGGNSTGFDGECSPRRMLIAAGSNVTVHVTVDSLDTLTSIDFILVDDAHNPADPSFGTLLGTDNNGGDGWSLTFNSAPYGNFSGVLVAQAHFTGHNEEIDGDQAVIMIGTQPHPCIPTVSEWGMVILLLTMLIAGTIIFGFRKMNVAGAEGQISAIEVNRPTFVPAVFGRSLVLSLGATVALLAAATYYFGPVKAVDIGGAFLSAIVLAYLVHLWILLKRP